MALLELLIIFFWFVSAQDTCVAEEIEKEKEKNNLRFKYFKDSEADFGAELMTTQIEFEAHVQILTKKVEEKEKVETVERDCQKKVETLKMENDEREMKNDKRMKDMKAKNEEEEEEE